MCSLACPLVYSERKPRGRLSCLSLCSLSPGVLRRGSRRRLVCYLCSLSPGTLLKGVPGEGFYVPGVVCPLVLREGYQGKTCLHICSLSPGASRRTPGEDLSCPSWCSLSLGTSRGVPGEGLSAYL